MARRQNFIDQELIVGHRTEPSQTGAGALVKTLVACGIDTCFANPGTSEMHFVAALDRIEGINCVLGLQENIVTGMADGYFRITGKPAVTLLHCGPGYSNGIANIHNARRAGSGMLNIVGDHARQHVAFDSPLTSDVAALIAATSDWSIFASSPAELGFDAARGVQAATKGYGQVASIVLPADISWSLGGVTSQPLARVFPEKPDRRAISDVARALRSGRRSLILLGTQAVQEPLHPVLAGLAAHTGAELMGSSTISHMPRGRGRLNLPIVPYPVDIALERLSSFDTVILVNCPPPTAFFLYPNRPSLLHRADAEVIVLSKPEQDAAIALQALADELGAASVSVSQVADHLPKLEGAITPTSLAQHVVMLLPENALFVNEAITLGAGFAAAFPYAPPFDWFNVTGGAIGGGPPLATGVAIGARVLGQGDRPVITAQADGSAAYTMQALWTQAREKLPVITLLLNNRSYAILMDEYHKVGADPGVKARAMMSLDNPHIDWSGLARSMGVSSHVASNHEELDRAIRDALNSKMPTLIDVQMISLV